MKSCSIISPLACPFLMNHIILFTWKQQTTKRVLWLVLSNPCTPMIKLSVSAPWWMISKLDRLLLKLMPMAIWFKTGASLRLHKDIMITDPNWPDWSSFLEFRHNIKLWLGMQPQLNKCMLLYVQQNDLQMSCYIFIG